MKRRHFLVQAARASLDRLGLARDTFLFFTSDNGPWMTKNQDLLDWFIHQWPTAPRKGE
jgi:arylsulfatase A-like enzyme